MGDGFVDGNGEWSKRKTSRCWRKGWMETRHQLHYMGNSREFLCRRLAMFDKNAFDVLEVNQTNYENCNSENFIANLTKGGRDVYQLMEARPYYFICSKGYCYGGMKLAIDTRNSPPPAPSPQGNNAASPSYFYAGRLNIMPVLVVAFALFIVSFA
ncbi:Lamin-like protein [Bienertia sinuspersici]